MAASRRGDGTSSALSVGAYLTCVVLVLTSTARYLAGHGLADRGALVLALSGALLACWASLLLVARGPRTSPVVVVGLLVVWAVLVLVAPSFAWCAVPLFVVCRTHLSPAGSVAAVTGVVAMTSVALYTLSGRSDWTAFVGPASVAVLLMLVLDGVERAARERLDLQRQITRSERRLAEARQEASVLAERERIALEIHDTVTQGLASGLLLLEAADAQWGAPHGPARADVRRATELVRANLAQTRGLVHDLASQPVPAGGPGLAAAVLDAARRQVPGATLAVQGEPVAVPPEVAHALLRITQSATGNVRRHAQATHVELTLTYHPGTVSLDILDDGIGFDPARVADPTSDGGYGLPAMRRRAHGLGGTVTVESTPGEGTVVATELPVAAGDASPATSP